MYLLFADLRRIVLPVASFSDEGVKEVKGLDDSLYTSLQFLELETQWQLHFPSCFKFPKLLITNAKSLNFDKLTEVKVLPELNQIDVIAVTEEQSHDQRSLRLYNYSEFIKLRPLDPPFGKKEVVSCFFTKCNLSPKLFLFQIYVSTMKSFG